MINSPTGEALTWCARCGGYMRVPHNCFGPFSFAPYEPGPRPNAVPVTFSMALTEADVRRIVREELERVAAASPSLSGKTDEETR